MIFKNPFLIKNNEQQEKEEEFLSLFDSSVLQIIEEQNLEKVSYVSSTPGAGKTSLFRAFSPQVLNIICKNSTNNEYADILKSMRKLGAIKENKPVLLSAMLSCARGYSIIEEMFENGRRKQVLFALLNYRIIIVYLNNLRKLLDYDLQDLSSVEFKLIPQEMLSEEMSFKNALEAYLWACAGEKELCNYLDSDRNDNISLSFVHTTLLSIKLFEPGNLIINGEEYLKNCILIFDDFHKLTETQRLSISEAIYTLKSKSGTWFGQRLEGLDSLQIVSMDGSLGRDYNPNIIIDKYWSNKKNTFYKVLENIADKRVIEARISKFRKFADCLEDNISISKYKKILNNYIEEIQKIINDNNAYNKYLNVINYIEETYRTDLFNKAINYECLKIRLNREKYGQLSLFEENESVDEFILFYEKTKDDAEYYLCYRCKIPFYYGIEKIKKMSSYNIEQFLYIAADVFDTSRVKSLGKSRKIKLTAEEQQTSIKKAAKKKWDDMDYRYNDIDDIKYFINAILFYAFQSRESERASYSGGAYTGIGIKSSELKYYANNEKYKKMVDILGKCLASNYLERREGENGEITIFYLNRWICLLNDLPLAYGGWKRCSLDTLNNMCKKDDTNVEQQSLF